MIARINRRKTITLLGGAVAWPFATRAQQGGRMRRLSVLVPLAENAPEAQARVVALTQGLNGLGWTEGRNLRIEYRWIAGGGIDRIRAAVAEVVAFVAFACTTSGFDGWCRNCSGRRGPFPSYLPTSPILSKPAWSQAWRVQAGT